MKKRSVLSLFLALSLLVSQVPLSFADKETESTVLQIMEDVTEKDTIEDTFNTLPVEEETKTEEENPETTEAPKETTNPETTEEPKETTELEVTEDPEEPETPEEHPAYFFSDENGLYHPERTLTRLELAIIVYQLLGEPNNGRISYSDVSVRATYAPAARLMKDLGLIRSNQFLADRTVTKGELVETMQSVFPEAVLRTSILEETMSLRDEEITRAETAKLVNAFAGRVPNEKRINRLFSIVPDMDKENEYYYDFAEAVLTHTAERIEDGVENWVGHEKYRMWKKGFVRLEGQLHYIGRDGTFVHGESVDGFLFDENGCYTSGLKELDELAESILVENVFTRETELEQLKAAYLYVIHIGQYRKGEIYSPGETGWSAEEAYKMLSTGYGNCYSYAAAFAELARALGFEAKACSGYVVGGNSGMTPHGWVEIQYGGKSYVCDPELQDVKLQDLFMMEIGTPNCDRWRYTQEEVFGDKAA